MRSSLVMALVIAAVGATGMAASAQIQHALAPTAAPNTAMGAVPAVDSLQRQVADLQAQLGKLQNKTELLQGRIDQLQAKQTATANADTQTKADLAALRADFNHHGHMQVLPMEQDGKFKMLWRETTIPAEFCKSNSGATSWADQQKCTAP